MSSAKRNDFERLPPFYVITSLASAIKFHSTFSFSLSLSLTRCSSNFCTYFHWYCVLCHGEKRVNNLKPHAKTNKKITYKNYFSENVIKTGMHATEDITIPPKLRNSYCGFSFELNFISTLRDTIMYAIIQNFDLKCVDCSYRLPLLWLHSKQKLTRFNFVGTMELVRFRRFVYRPCLHRIARF